MAISTEKAPMSGRDGRTGLHWLWRGIRWMLWLSGVLVLSLLTGIVFYIITGLSQWAALLLLSILVLVAFFRRWPLARRAMLADRLMQAEPWIWAGALIAGVAASVILVWSGEFGSAWIVLGLVGLGLVAWVKRQNESAEEQTTEVDEWPKLEAENADHDPWLANWASKRYRDQIRRENWAKFIGTHWTKD